jgi:TonB family protein
MTRSALFFVLFLYALKPEIAAAADQSLESALNQQYHDKIMALRHPLEKDFLAFDADGKVLKGGHEGPWTLSGRILVKNIRIEQGSISIEGKRLNYIQAGHDLTPVAAGKLKIEIKQARPAASAEEMNALLGQVFAFTDEEMIASAPEFWRKYLKDQVARAHGEKPQESFRQSHPDEIKVIEALEGKDGEPVAVLHKVGGGTVRPKPRYTPEPEYTEAARHEKYQGRLQIEMIVDETGAVKRPRIILPLGMGLDENAVNTVLTWKFDPARMDGKPVPVILRVEVSFRLY